MSIAECEALGVDVMRILMVKGARAAAGQTMKT